jgi:protein-tyrosine phosphatase
MPTSWPPSARGGAAPHANPPDHTTRPRSMNDNDAASRRTSVLFVCLGNICRSPLAEGIFRRLVQDAGLSERFEIDSAGTGAWHVGEQPDARASMVARQHGVALECTARQITHEDFHRFDYVIAMDRENLRNVRRIADTTGSDAEIRLLREFDHEADGDEVPDPYYGGASGFETVYEMVHRSCATLLERLRGA